MRLWSLHPKYLDAAGLVAAWREALLAQAVLRGRTRGYRHHPQLRRFRELASPVSGIARYLLALQEEAAGRGYRFDVSRVARATGRASITVTRGQLDYEWKHLMRKLRARSPTLHRRWRDVARPEAHPIFRVVQGGVAPWETTY